MDWKNSGKCNVPIFLVDKKFTNIVYRQNILYSHLLICVLFEGQDISMLGACAGFTDLDPCSGMVRSIPQCTGYFVLLFFGKNFMLQWLFVKIILLKLSICLFFLQLHRVTYCNWWWKQAMEIWGWWMMCIVLLKIHFH